MSHPHSGKMLHDHPTGVDILAGKVDKRLLDKIGTFANF